MEVGFKYDLEIEKEEFLGLLPENYTTLVTAYSKIKGGIDIELRTNITNKEEALTWKSQFEEKSKTYYNADVTFEEDTVRRVFKRIYHCLHNTRPRSKTKIPHFKHTNCNARLSINVKQKTMKRSKDVFLKILPCIIKIRYQHNHSIDYTASCLHKRRRITEKVEKKLPSETHLPNDSAT